VATEAIDNSRAWKERLQIHRAVFNQKNAEMLSKVECPKVAYCARDEVLYPFFGNLRKVKSDIV
jgi:hypothetical protein